MSDLKTRDRERKREVEKREVALFKERRNQIRTEIASKNKEKMNFAKQVKHD